MVIPHADAEIHGPVEVAFTRRHLPTGRVWRVRRGLLSVAHAQRATEIWNRMLPRVWRYSLIPTTKTKQNRAQILQELTAIAERFGAEITIDEWKTAGGKDCGCGMMVRLNGVTASIAIVSEIDPEIGSIDWVADRTEPGKALARRFQIAVGDYDHTPNRRIIKANTTAPWALLAAHLQAGLRHLSKGTAFADAPQAG